MIVNGLVVMVPLLNNVHVLATGAKLMFVLAQSE
jgi:hypothetical protein